MDSIDTNRNGKEEKNPPENLMRNHQDTKFLTNKLSALFFYLKDWYVSFNNSKIKEMKEILKSDSAFGNFKFV